MQQWKDNLGCVSKLVNRLIPSNQQERQIYTKAHKLVADQFNEFFFSSVGKKAASASAHLGVTNNINMRESVEISIPENRR